jgi:hypothetical protein
MRVFISLLVFTSFLLTQAFAQGSFVDTFSLYLTPEFVAWTVIVAAMGAIAAFVSRRIIAMALVRKGKFIDWLKKGENIVAFSFFLSFMVSLFISQPGIIADAKALNIIPPWQSVLIISFLGVLGSSGNYDMEQQKSKQLNSESKKEQEDDNLPTRGS